MVGHAATDCLAALLFSKVNDDMFVLLSRAQLVRMVTLVHQDLPDQLDPLAHL